MTGSARMIRKLLTSLTTQKRQLLHSSFPQWYQCTVRFPTGTERFCVFLWSVVSCVVVQFQPTCPLRPLTHAKDMPSRLVGKSGADGRIPYHIVAQCSIESSASTLSRRN